MSTRTTSQPSKHERKGSFFKLIDSFAWEIGTLKKEMGKKSEPAEGDHNTDAQLGLCEEVGGLFLQASPCAGIRAVPAGARDSGYDSLRRRLSILDRLVQTHPVWLQLGLSYQDATHILQSQPTGAFVVRKSTSLQRKVISLRMDKDSAVPVRDFPVKESQYTFSLEGSGLSFADLFRLVAFCCISRDVLPFTLKLPEAIASARTSADLDEVAKLGAGFWNRKKGSLSLSGIPAPNRPPLPSQRPVSSATTPGTHWLPVRTPSELDCCQSNGALCFINPLFIKVHQQDANDATLSNPCNALKQSLTEKPINNSLEAHNKDSEPSCGACPQVCSSDLSDGSQSKLQQQDNSIKPSCNREKLSASSDGLPQSPPPRPPPPRFASRRSVQHNMPEKISWIKVPKEKVEEKTKGSSQIPSRSISPSSSPPSRLSISAPISIPWPSLPISLSSLSSSPRQAKASPSYSQEDAQCHLALQDHIIERALMRAKLYQRNATRTSALNSSSPSDPLLMTTSKRAKVTGEEDEEEVEECSGGGQRLSDMSISTDSSDSLDFSHSSAFFLPPLHDPSPPTEADFNQHLPLSIPPCHLPYCSMEEDEDDEEDEDEEEQDYGVGLESDQDQDQELTMVPPGHGTKRRPSASALVLQTAFRRQFRKMSGVFNSLLTPEKRAIRRVVELSRNRGSYFGCLVQDFLSYMGEGAGTQAWQGFASGLELLQTVRQFITQMKSYLRESSELEPPIESLIPEDQIDRVLEKSLLKCILKPLKGVVRAALQEFQVRSGEWQELKDNLSLAKAKHPQELGMSDTLPPHPMAIEKIKHKLQTMIKLYSPEKKVTMLLRVCKVIYDIMEDNSGRPYGADDFLPMLTYVLAQCDMPQLDNEIQYMMELLDPSLLNGEGGYYLTSAFGAMSLIRNFQEDQAAKMLSSETRNTLHQWHSRRTSTQRSTPSIEDFQNYLRVALQELNSGCTAKTLKVAPYATVEEVCQLCAQKFKVSEPEQYGLFLVMEGSSQQLAPDNHPQKIKAELHSHSQVGHFHFVFRRIADGGTLPSTLNLNDPTVTPDTKSSLSDSLSLRLSLPPSHLNNNSISI